MFSKKLDPVLIECNAKPGTTASTYRPIIEAFNNTIESTMDLMFESFVHVDDPWNYWKKQDLLKKGTLEFLINEATGYNFIDEYYKKQE